jgi:neutral ceramidase
MPRAARSLHDNLRDHLGVATVDPPVLIWLRRSYLRALIGLAVLLALAGVSLITRVDESAYTTWAAYTDVVAKLEAEASKVAIARGSLEAGFGKASLSPHLDGSEEDWRAGRFPRLSLAGFSERRGKSATGVRDPLWVKSIAVRVGGQTVVLTSLDMLIVPPSVTELVTDRLPAINLSRAQLFLSATHTHSGPGGWGGDWATRLVAGPHREGVSLWIAQQIERSIEAALSDLEPAGFGEAWVEIPELLQETTNVHSGFPVLTFRQADGTKAIFGSYAAHPIILSASNLEFSGDYPAAWQRAMEERGFALAMFAAGPMGGQSPAGASDSLSAAEGFGDRLANRLNQPLLAIDYKPETELASLGVELTLPDPQVRFADMWRIRPWVARAILPLKPQTYLQAIRIGRTILISTPCDFSGELALSLEGRMRDLGWIAAVTSFNGDYMGYVMPSERYHDGSYETGVMSFFGPGIGEFMSEVMARVANALASPTPSTAEAASSVADGP